jgi:CIC family chloride channel protein
VIALTLGKIAATSLTIGIGGSVGVFAPSLFIGVHRRDPGHDTFGDIASHLFGSGTGQPAPVPGGRDVHLGRRAAMTSLGSVVEMADGFGLTLPGMLAVVIASTVSRALSYRTIYTTKLLCSGTDIDRTGPPGQRRSSRQWRRLRGVRAGPRWPGRSPASVTRRRARH